MTLNEARSKLCPFSLNYNFNGKLCAADICMAWKWSTVPVQDTAAGSTMPLVYKISTTDGYCGMVSK